MRSCISWTRRYPPAIRTSSAQLSHIGRFLFSIALTTGSVTEMFAPFLSISRATPWNARNAARVTTNDGMRTFATSVPSANPMTTPVTIDTSTARYHGQWLLVSSSARTAAHTPLVNPADRSISPSSRTNTRPMAMMITWAPWVNRLAKLIAEKNTGRSTVNTMHSTTSPATAGSEPRSPPRNRRR